MLGMLRKVGFLRFLCCGLIMDIPFKFEGFVKCFVWVSGEAAFLKFGLHKVSFIIMCTCALNL